MIYKAIQQKQKSIDPEKFNTRIVEDNLAEVDSKYMQWSWTKNYEEGDKQTNKWS